MSIDVAPASSSSRARIRRFPTAVMLVVLMVLALVALAPATGAGQPGFPPGTPPGSPPAVAGVTTATPSNVSPYPVLQRLGRWDGTVFQPVSAGSLPAGHVVFLSHGWSPGYLAPYLALQAKSATLVTAWTPGLVNAANESMVATWGPVAQSLQAADPTATIVFFSWIDQSATGENPLDARLGEDATEVNGHRLATAIDQALARGFYSAGGQVHLVGHSFGANVATTAALSLMVPPRQLTLLDSPETTLAQLGGAKNDLRYKLPRLDIGRGPGQTFVDNYISFVGIRYGTFPGLDQVVDVKTAPPTGDSAALKHSFAIVWYQASAKNMSAGVGYAWSPLLGADDTTLGSYYQQPDPTNTLRLDQVVGPPPAGVRTQMLLSTATLDVPGAAVVRTGSSFGTAPASAGTSGVELGGSSSTTWNLTFSTDETSLWIDFALVFQGTPGDSISLFVDGRQRYQAAVPGAGAGAAGSFLILYDVTPGDHVLSATISGPSWATAANPATTATLSHLRLSSTADIQRNLTAAETDDLIGVALFVIVFLLVTMIVAIVLVIRYLRRRGRRTRARTAAEKLLV